MTRRVNAIVSLLLLFAFLATPLSRGFAQNHPEWTEPFPPFKIIDNVYYVGSKDLAAYLIVTTDGNILINSNLESSVAQIKKSIEQLGFKFGDTRILLISHAHLDHAAGSATIIKQTGAKYMVMDGDVPVVEDGGKSDFFYGDKPGAWFKPTKVDRVLHDGDTVSLGQNVLVARKTPGHTRGCTTWMMAVKIGNRTYNVVIVGSPNVNPGYKLIDNAKYPDIAYNFEYTFSTLKSLDCDIFLGAHGSYFGLAEKYAKLKQGAAAAFVDPAGYRQFVMSRDEAFRAELARQKAASN